MLPACLISIINPWFLHVGSQVLFILYPHSTLQSVRTQQKLDWAWNWRCRLLKWRSSSAPGDGGLCRHWPQPGAELALTTLLEVSQAAGPGLCRGEEKGKGRERHLPGHSLLPSLMPFPHGTSRAAAVPVSMPRGTAKSFPVKNWVFRKYCLLHSG